MASLEDPSTDRQSKRQRLTVLDAFIMSGNDDYKLVRLTYVSRPVRKLAEEEKIDLLTVAKRRNAEMSITGILFIADDLYMQTLEGPRVSIVDLLRRLNRDGRHHQMTITSIEYIETRIYPRWSMERVQLSEDSLFIMNNLFNTIVTSFDVLRTYSQQSVIMDWLANTDKPPKVETETKPKKEDIVLVVDIVEQGISFRDELDTKQYVTLINHFLKVCSDVITGFRGQFTKYIGDSAIGIFGVENVENAIAAALEIQRLLAQLRERTAVDEMDPQQILFAGIGIEIGFFELSQNEEDIPQTVQEKNFLDFFGAAVQKTKATLFGSSKNMGYDLYEGEGLDHAMRFKRATTFYKIPILISEKVRNEFLSVRKKAQGLQNYHQDTMLPKPTNTAPKRSAQELTSFVSPFAPIPNVQHNAFDTLPGPSTSSNKKELELNLVGTVRVPSSKTGEDEFLSVFTPSSCLAADEPFRSATEVIARWKKHVEKGRYSL